MRIKGTVEIKITVSGENGEECGSKKIVIADFKVSEK